MPSGPVPAGESPQAPEIDYQRLFDLSLDLVCVAGLDGYFKRVNPSWTRTLGWSQAELLARPVADFMHPEDRDRTLLARAGLAKGMPVRGLENRYLCKDGSFRWLSWQSSIELGSQRVYAVARDITERRQRDQEHLVFTKLECTGLMAGGIAHDFNNLLGGLLLGLDMVPVCGPLNEEQHLYWQRARDSVMAATSLTRQLIIFANADRSERQVVALDALLLQAVDAALLGSSIRCELRLEPTLWNVEVDEGQVSQVISGIVLNAREAMGASGSIRLEAENVLLPSASGESAAPTKFVRVRVIDSGAGIPPEILPKVFDPYFSTKQRGSRKGMGLGLTICRSVIQKHGGTIGIDSTPGRGTVVTFELPAGSV